MSPSTASTKSACLTLALVALTRPSAAAVLDLGGSGAALGAATVLHRLPIHLPSRATDDGGDLTARRNASAYDVDTAIDDEGGFELPRELAEMIADAKKSQPQQGRPGRQPTAAPTRGDDGARYYPTYAEGELCSAKSTAEFESWEESYASLADCCDAAFSWDYEACVGL